MTAATEPAQPNLIDRVFGLKRHEYAAVAWSFVYFFCVLCAYYILRPVREAMAVDSGAGTIPYLFIGTFVATLVVTPIFGWIASRFPRRVFLPWIYLFFVSNILIFWFVFSTRVEDGLSHVWLGRTFFVWLSVFNLFVVSVFWSFMADIYTREQGRRLFGLITSGGSIGSIAASAMTGLVVTDIGFQNLFPISAALLSVSVICIRKLRKWVVHEHSDSIESTAESNKPLGGTALSGVTHTFSSKYFGGIVTSSVIASLLGTALYMFAAQLVEQQIAETNERTQFYAYINLWAGVFTFVGQMFLVRHVVRIFGIGASLSLQPLVSIAGFVLLAIDPALGVIAFITSARRALGFTFSKPTTDMLYSVVTPEEKYKTKNFIDTAVYRFGDVVGTWSIKAMMGLGMTGVSLVMLPFAAVWAGVSIWLGRDYRRRARELKESGIE